MRPVCVSHLLGVEGSGGGRLRLRNGIIRFRDNQLADGFIGVYFHYAKRSILSVNFKVNKISFEITLLHFQAQKY